MVTKKVAQFLAVELSKSMVRYMPPLNAPVEDRCLTAHCKAKSAPITVKHVKTGCRSRSRRFGSDWQLILRVEGVLGGYIGTHTLIKRHDTECQNTPLGSQKKSYHWSCPPGTHD